MNTTITTSLLKCNYFEHCCYRLFCAPDNSENEGMSSKILEI